MPRSSTRLRRGRNEQDEEEKEEEEQTEDSMEFSPPNVKAPSTKRRQGRKTKDEKMRDELEILGEEYDVAALARTSHGHLRRTVPRNQWRARTEKRKKLEAADEKATNEAMHFGRNDDMGRNRLRGSQKAFDRQVIEDSQIFPVMTRRQTRNNHRDDSDADSEEDEDEDVDDSDYEQGDKSDDNDGDEAVEEEKDDVEMDDDENDNLDDEEDDESAIEEDLEDDAVEDEGSDDEGESPARSKKRRRSESKLKTRKRRIAPKETKRRRLLRLRNFQSQRLARCHGDALAAHARGQPLEAIQLLKEVAKKAPSAPQVYSSLGMVYQDMLRECRSARLERGELSYDTPTVSSIQPLSDLPTHRNPEANDDITDKEKSIPDPALAEQFDLAKKAYGSYHIAAILYRKDFSLWDRAADAGADVVDTLKEVALLPSLSSSVVAHHREEWKRWQSEILRDLQSADSLKPPGIDIPCKLAAVHIELGNLSEALTILTDLKNRQDPSRPGRSEFQSCYKTWILYAELMLRVGHECMLWNQGIKLNSNYMFRRWLRKYSKVFDWQERRLQALCLALEAAAGSKSVSPFIVWLRNRALANPSHRKDDDSDDDDDNKVARDDPDSRTAQTASERQLLLTQQATEMEDYDKTTRDMNLDVNSKAAMDRQAGRDGLLKAQRIALASVNNENDDTEKRQPVEQDDQILTDFGDLMPISGSCRQVCSIASELMKHLHGLELYNGVRLVGDAVSSYFKLRAAKHDDRRQAARRADEWQEKMNQPSFLFATYEEASDDEESLAGDGDQLLSDDEDLDREEGASVLDSLRKGVLPPELRIMYGLALIGEGGRNFLASKCLEAIDDLEQESGSSLPRGEREIEMSGNPRWYLFRRAMTEALGRNAAYAFLADVLRKSGKEKDWSIHFAPWFRRHLANVLKDNWMALRGEESVSSFLTFRKNQVIKIMVAACGFNVDLAERITQKSPVSREEVVMTDTERATIAMDALKRVAEVLHLAWKVEDDGSISPICTEIVHVSSRCLRWLAQETNSKLSYNQLNEVLEHARTILSFLSGYGGVPDHQGSSTITNLIDESWASWPLSASWQDEEYRPLSLKVFNLTVACNVSLFSGWETDEFTLRLLRRAHGHKHFGVHLRDDKRITGVMSLEIEKDICHQWSIVRTVLPQLPDFDLQKRLDGIKSTSWYKEEVDLREKAWEEMTRYAEESAEKMFLAYSDLCLQMAVSEQNPLVVNRLMHTSLSILLPVTQFCVDRRLWYSDIGEAACTLSGFDEWKLMKQVGIDETLTGFENKPRQRRKLERVVEKKLQEWIKGSGKPTWKSFVSLPLSEMRSAWFQDCQQASIKEKQSAREFMENVHKATEKLRKCYTEVASEKVCLSISKALLDLAAHRGCYDPFRCMQQAAMYASQANKAGHSDVPFRDKLPEPTLCTSLQALVILGRADCLHSTYFPNESLFLLTYVARVCRLHRMNDGDDAAELPWNIQWKVVAIYAFNVSVMIRTTVETVLDKQQQRSFLSMWDRDVVEELERGRIEGWNWKRSLTGNADTGIADEMDDFDSDEEAENSEGDVEDDDRGDESNEEDMEVDPANENDTEMPVYEGMATWPIIPPGDEGMVSQTVYQGGFTMEELHIAEFLIPPRPLNFDTQEINDDAFQGIEMVSI